MADPLSIAASIVGIAGAGIKVANALHSFVETIKTASRRVQNLANDISSTSGILTQLGELIQPKANINGKLVSIFTKAALLEIQIRSINCRELFDEIDKELKGAVAGLRDSKSNSDPGASDNINLTKSEKAKWHFNQSTFEDLRTELHHVKANLLIMITVANLRQAENNALGKDPREIDQQERNQLKATIIALRRSNSNDQTMQLSRGIDQKNEKSSLRTFLSQKLKIARQDSLDEKGRRTSLFDTQAVDQMPRSLKSNTGSPKVPAIPTTKGIPSTFGVTSVNTMDAPRVQSNQRQIPDEPASSSQVASVSPTPAADVQSDDRRRLALEGLPAAASRIVSKKTKPKKLLPPPPMPMPMPMPTINSVPLVNLAMVPNAHFGDSKVPPALQPTRGQTNIGHSTKGSAEPTKDATNVSGPDIEIQSHDWAALYEQLSAWTVASPPIQPTGSHEPLVRNLHLPRQEIIQRLDMAMKTNSSVLDSLVKLNLTQSTFILDHVAQERGELLLVDELRHESVISIWGNLDIVLLIWVIGSPANERSRSPNVGYSGSNRRPSMLCSGSTSSESDVWSVPVRQVSAAVVQRIEGRQRGIEAETKVEEEARVKAIRERELKMRYDIEMREQIDTEDRKPKDLERLEAERRRMEAELRAKAEFEKELRAKSEMGDLREAAITKELEMKHKAEVEKMRVEEARAKAEFERQIKAKEEMAWRKKEEIKRKEQVEQEMKRKVEAQKKMEEEARVKDQLEKDKAQLPIHFKDAVGRKFEFPYYQVRTLKGLRNLVNEAFLYVDTLSSHIEKDQYDLVDSNNTIILPSLWETAVKPDMNVSMQLWPLPEPDEQPPAPQGFFSSGHAAMPNFRIDVPGETGPGRDSDELDLEVFPTSYPRAAPAFNDDCRGDWSAPSKKNKKRKSTKKVEKTSAAETDVFPPQTRPELKDDIPQSDDRIEPPTAPMALDTDLSKTLGIVPIGPNDKWDAPDSTAVSSLRNIIRKSSKIPGQVPPPAQPQTGSKKKTVQNSATEEDASTVGFPRSAPRAYPDIPGEALPPTQPQTGPKKKKGQMRLSDFMADQNLGSWADEMEDGPGALPPISKTEKPSETMVPLYTRLGTTCSLSDEFSYDQDALYASGPEQAHDIIEQNVQTNDTSANVSLDKAVERARRRRRFFGILRPVDALKRTRMGKVAETKPESDSETGLGYTHLRQNPTAEKQVADDEDKAVEDLLNKWTNPVDGDESDESLP